MNQSRTQSPPYRPGTVLFVVLVSCLLLTSQRTAADTQADPPIEMFWTADETGKARPTAEEVRAAVQRIPETASQAATPQPRASYSDASNDLLFKWLHPEVEDYGLSVGGGVMQTDMPTQALGLPSSFYWQAVTFDSGTYNLARFDIVPNSSSAFFNGTSATLSDGTLSSIPAFTDLTQVSINNNGSSTRWRLTSRGVHPAWPDNYRLAYNNKFTSGSVDLTQFIGATPFTGIGWRWALRDHGSILPGWDDNLDLISVGVDTTANKGIRFSARVDGSLMSNYGANAVWPRFEWYIDADNDAATGDNFTFSYQEGTYVFRYDLVGVEAIATAFYDPDSGRWVGLLRKKVSPSEWQTLDVGIPSLSYDTVSIDFSQATAGLRSTYRWGLVSSFDIRRGSMNYSGRVDVAPNSGMKTETLPTSPDQLLAERYAPILMLANTAELYPVSIDYTLSQSSLRARSGSLITAEPVVDDLTGHSTDGSYLDFYGSDAAETIGQWTNSKESTRSPVIYAHIARSGSRTAIQYWFHYFYSGWGYTKGCNKPGICLRSGDTRQYGNNHEGDWEMAQVVLENGVPQYAAYAQHHGATKRLWQHVEKGGPNAENPLVYVGYGSHASYFKDSYYKAGFEILGNYLAESTGRNAAPSLAVELLLTDEEPEWLKFRGYWGKDNSYFLNIDLLRLGGSPPGPRWEDPDKEDQREKWSNPFGWGDHDAKWDDDHHYGTSFGLFTDAYKVTLSGPDSRHVNLQLKSGLNVVLDKNTNVLDSTGRRAEFMLNCGADARQTILLHKTNLPMFSWIDLNPSWSEITCPTGLRDNNTTAEAIRLTIELNVPQKAMEQIVTARFVDVEIPTDGQASINLDSPDLMLQIDQDGDGVVDQTVAPTTTAAEATDLTPPAAIGDLAFTDDGLRWTAPADEGPSGLPAAYQVRYAEFPITEATWDFAKPYIHELTPGAPGTQQVLALNGLPPGNYFFAIRSTDEVYNISAVSNKASGHISDEGFRSLITVIIR